MGFNSGFKGLMSGQHLDQTTAACCQILSSSSVIVRYR